MSARTRRATGRVFLNLAAVVVFVCSVFPVYWMVNTAFLPGSAVKSETPHFWPDQFTLRSFQAAWEGGFVPALWVSLAVTLLTVVAALVFAFLASIAVSRYRFRSRKSFIVAILVIQMIPAEAMIISTFRVLDGWHLLNTVIGLSAVLLMLLEGRIAGISGIAGRLLPPYRDGAFLSRFGFVIGLVAAPFAMMALTGDAVEQTVSSNIALMVAAGLLVGFGTVWGSGCTSGHGVCGLSRLSARSLAATVVFMATAIVTVFLVRHVIGA